MKTIKMIFFVCGIILVISFCCKKDEQLPLYHAKGRIIETFGGCYGEWIMIEIENPKDIGSPGSFISPGNEEKKIDYRNAIGVPYFSRLPYITDTIKIGIGSYLYFKYREVVNDEQGLFLPEPPPACPANIAAPPAKRYIITEVIDHN